MVVMRAIFDHIAVAILVFAAVPAGFAERPTEAELIATKTLAVWCALGVQERCLATQYADDPAAYRVAPPSFAGTNASGWPLDQTMMATLDSKIKDLVPWYVDTNGAALTVSGILVSLSITNRNDLFIRDSSATSAVWNAADLTERYQVLWTLRQTTSSVTRTYAERWEGSGAITNDANTPLSDGCAQAYEVAADDYDCTGSGSLIGGVWTNDATLQTAKLQQWARNTVAIGYQFPTNLVVTGGTNIDLDHTNIVVVSVSNSALPYFEATGGIVTTAGEYLVHTFLSNGTFSVTEGTVTGELLVVAGGGGGGGGWAGGGGGGGGMITTAIVVSESEYPVFVGTGGAGGECWPGGDPPYFQGGDGSNSSFGEIIAIGGGGGGQHFAVGRDGGSGGGTGPGAGPSRQLAGSGTSEQGHDGGQGSDPAWWEEGGGDDEAGGGGGAGEVGETPYGGDGCGTNNLVNVGGNGGDGLPCSYSGTEVYYAGGGGGGGAGVSGIGGLGGGGDGAWSYPEAGAENTGGGGGGCRDSTEEIGGAPGGSGIVIIRYKNQSYIPPFESSGLYTSNAPINGASSWACASMGCFIYYTNSQWVISTNTALNTNQAYLYKTGAPVGDYTPVNFTSGSTTAGYEYVYLPGTNSPAGLYLYDMDYYTSNAPQWHYEDCAENEYRASQGDDGYYHIAWQSGVNSSSWKNVSWGYYLGVYLPESNATGTVYAESQLWETGPAIYTSLTYAVQLTKIGASNDFFASTNRQHKVDYYAYPTRPTAGDSNYYDDQELNLTESSWNWIHSIDWSYSSYNPVWAIGTLNVLPSPAPEAGTNAVDLDIYAGFEFERPLKPIAEWKFQYCTNQFW